MGFPEGVGEKDGMSCYEEKDPGTGPGANRRVGGGVRFWVVLVFGLRWGLWGHYNGRSWFLYRAKFDWFGVLLC